VIQVLAWIDTVQTLLGKAFPAVDCDTPSDPGPIARQVQTALRVVRSAPRGLSV